MRGAQQSKKRSKAELTEEQLEEIKEAFDLFCDDPGVTGLKLK